MTLGGTFTATLVLFVLLLCGGWVGWQNVSQTKVTTTDAVTGQPVTQYSLHMPGWIWAVMLGAFGLAMVTIFKPKLARITGADLRGGRGRRARRHLGRCSTSQYQGIVLQAVMATLSVFAVMLFLYATRLVRVTERMRRIVLFSMLGILVMYLVSFVASWIGGSVPFIDNPSPLGIGISVVIVVVASMNLMLNFDFIERAVVAKAPRVHGVVRRLRADDRPGLAVPRDPAPAGPAAPPLNPAPGPSAGSTRIAGFSILLHVGIVIAWPSWNHEGVPARRSSGHGRQAPSTRRGALAPLIDSLLGSDLPIGFRAYDGTQLGPPDPPATIVVHSPDALRRMATAPGELGLARAYVAGDIDLEGDIFAALEVRNRIAGAKIGPREVLAILQARSVRRRFRPLPPPPEEAKPRGRLHSRSRDAAAIQHHYDVGNEFYELLLGDDHDLLVRGVGGPRPPRRERARRRAVGQVRAHLPQARPPTRPATARRRLRLGWDGSATPCATTASGRSASRCRPSRLVGRRARNEQEGLADRVEIRLQDYRDISDGPFDAISSIGMFEHVGRARLREYFTQLYSLLPPEGRLLNHAISRPPNDGERINPRGFMARYVFPDGELIEVGSVVTELQSVGFEARHVEDLREHYALTLRAWVANLEANWDEAVRLVGRNRARIWRLYLAGCAVNFDDAGTQIYQVLGVKLNGGRSGMDLRPTWDRRDLRRRRAQRRRRRHRPRLRSPGPRPVATGRGRSARRADPR